MSTSHYLENNIIATLLDPQEKSVANEIIDSKILTANHQLIRFEEKKDRYIHVCPDEIVFVKSADHYVKSLIKCGKQKKWMSRHCTIKELLVILPAGNFMRLNKFYLLNRNHFSRINEREKALYFDDGFFIPIPHRISRYVLDLLKNNYT